MADSPTAKKIVYEALSAVVLVLVLKTALGWETSPTRARLLEARQWLGESWQWVIDRERFKRTMRETLDTIETTEE